MEHGREQHVGGGRAGLVKLDALGPSWFFRESAEHLPELDDGAPHLAMLVCERGSVLAREGGIERERKENSQRNFMVECVHQCLFVFREEFGADASGGTDSDEALTGRARERSQEISDRRGEHASGEALLKVAQWQLEKVAHRDQFFLGWDELP